MFNSDTIFNLVSNNTLDLSSKINVDGISQAELTVLSSTDTTLFQFRSNLHLKNLRIQGDIENDVDSGSFFLRPIYLQEKALNLTNLDIQLTGMILRTFDPMSMFIQNVYVDFHAMQGGFNMNIQCNYPEAYLGGILKSSNMTAENAQNRIAAFRIPFIVTSGPENIYFEDTNLYIWGSLSEDRAIVETTIKSDCLPDDDRDITFTFIKTKMSMPNNPNKDKFTSYFVDISSDSIRKPILNYLSGEYTDQYQMPYPTHHVFSNIQTEINIINATFSNVTGANGGTMTTLSNSVVIQNTVYQNWDNFGFDTFLLLQSNTIKLTNLTFRNVNGTGSSTEYYVSMKLNSGGTATLDNVKFYDWNLKEKAGLRFEGSVSNLSITNSEFSNVDVGNANAIILAQDVSTLAFSNCTFMNVEQSTSDDESMKMVNFQNFNLNSASNSSISNITIESSKISFLEFASISGTPNQPVELQISQIVYQNCNYDLSLSLISFGNLETYENISYTFDNIKFENITFAYNGKIMEFKHQLYNDIIVQNSIFNDLVGWEIYVQAANQNSDILTRVNFKNSNFTNIDANYNSLMAINEGAYVTIENWIFRNVSTLEEGSVIYAGYRKATVIIKNSTFTNNFAYIGGVFSIESESVVKLYDCVISNNFAITSGVFHANNNGYFEIYNTLIIQNYAISSMISQVFDVATSAVVDGSQIYSNLGLSVSDFTNEININCNLLCFLTTKFITYLRAHPSLYSVSESSYCFQLISGGLTIQNSTNLRLQNSIVDSFESALTINSSKFYNIEVSDSSFKISSTTLNILNSDFYNVTEELTNPFFRITFDSIVNIK